MLKNKIKDLIKLIERTEIEEREVSSFWGAQKIRLNKGGIKPDSEKKISVDTNVTEEIIYNSLYDIAKIRTLYSNLDTVSFWGIKNQIQILKDRGYSTSEMQAKYQKTI